MGEWHYLDSGCISSLDQFFSSRNVFGLKEYYGRAGRLDVVNALSLIQTFHREMNQICYSPVARMRRSPAPSPSSSQEFSFHRLLFVAYPLRWKREKAMKVAKPDDSAKRAGEIR